MPTLNQVVKIIGDLASNHKQIKSYYFGDFPDYLSRGTDNVYPSMFYDLSGANIAGNTLSLNFSLYFFDRMLAEGTNETEVLSDMLEVAQDIVAQLAHPNFQFDITTSVNMDFFTEDTPDLLAGVRADITLELPYLTNRCVVPSTFIFPS
jgi:hypothetical protein